MMWGMFQAKMSQAVQPFAHSWEQLFVQASLHGCTTLCPYTYLWQNVCVCVRVLSVSQVPSEGKKSTESPPCIHDLPLQHHTDCSQFVTGTTQLSEAEILNSTFLSKLWQSLTERSSEGRKTKHLRAQNWCWAEKVWEPRDTTIFPFSAIFRFRRDTQTVDPKFAKILHCHDPRSKINKICTGAGTVTDYWFSVIFMPETIQDLKLFVALEGIFHFGPDRGITGNCTIVFRNWEFDSAKELYSFI